MELRAEDIKNLAEAIGRLLGPGCEVVLHDFTADLEHSVAYIVNGSVSGREPGDCPSTLLMEQLANYSPDMGKNIEYYTTTDDGRTIRSSNTMITDSQGKLTGAVCINLDISGLMAAQSALGCMVGDRTGETRLVSEKFARNVQELMSYYLAQLESRIGKTGADMDKQEKLRALEYLDERGAFQIARAHVRLCQFFGISKYTLYTYLDEVRRKDKAEEQDNIL